MYNERLNKKFKNTKEKKYNIFRNKQSKRRK